MEIVTRISHPTLCLQKNTALGLGFAVLNTSWNGGKKRLLKREPNKMVVWKAWSQESELLQFFATKKEAVAWLKYQESEDETIEKIVINDRGDMALQLNFLADLMNCA